MALYVGSGIAKGVFSASEAEAAFHPWWDTIKDYSLYGMVLIGLLATPTANSLLTCTTEDPYQSSPVPSSFLNEYCTRENLQVFQIFFPYALILGPLTLIALQKVFAKSGQGMKLQKFYQLLVKTTLGQERLADLQREDMINLKELNSPIPNHS